jgi:heptosyltransferase I
MGDVVHALPMVSDIARAFPNVRVDWVVEEGFADIPRLHPAVTRVLPIALRRWRRHPFSHNSWAQLLAGRAALRQDWYHTIIDCQGLLKSAVVAWSARGPVAGFAAASAREPAAALFYQRRIAVDTALHAVERNRRLAAGALDYIAEGPEDYGLRQRVMQMNPGPPFDEDGAVLLLTNASRATKLWPDEHWVALERELARRGRLSVLAWGSDAEGEATRARAARMQSAHVLPSASLAQIAALAGRVSLVVGLDTGLTHLAAAVGAPTVGIFCDYDPVRVGVRGSARVASLGGVDQTPSVADVLAAAERVTARDAA